MNLKHLFIACLFLSRFPEIYAQPINNTASYRAIPAGKYIRFYYDNDFFTSTDGNYTQGLNFEIVHPAISKSPLGKLLVSLKGSEKKYGMSLEHLGYTPSSIRHVEIIYRDRPFSATLYLKTFKQSFDTTRNILLTSLIELGGIGPVAGGEWMQKTIHRNLNNIEPLGWHNQIKNDVVINYSIILEKALIPESDNFMLSSITKLNAGTLRNNIATGFSATGGKFSNPFFTVVPLENKFHIKFYASSLINIIGYDASLQGGLFNRSSPYTIDAHNLSRVVWSSEAGIIIQLKKLSLEYFQHLKSREFKTGTYHRWGGIRIGLNFG